jgi:drug/metabolite transporter (DMT)-like permease
MSIFANIFTFRSMKWEKLNNIEPAKILEPLFVILLAIIFSFFFEGFDKNPKVMIPAILSILALTFSHIKKYHLNFNKYFIYAIIGSFFFALELVISRLILDLYNPITFYFIRGLFLFAIGFALFRPSLKGIETKIKIHVLIIGAIWVIFRVITYWGYLKLGVIFTTLIMLLGPVFIYLFAHIFLKEKYNWKNIIASAVIVASVIYATVN